MRGEQRGVVDAREGDVGGGELRGQRRVVGRAEHGLHLAIGQRAALHPLHVGGEIGIGGERLVVQHLLRQRAPLAVALDRNKNIGAFLWS